MVINLVYKALDGATKLLQRDIERAYNKIGKLNAEISETAVKLEARVAYYKELIKEAQDQHAEVLADNTKAVQQLIIRRNTASRLKAAITKLTTGEIV